MTRRHRKRRTRRQAGLWIMLAVVALAAAFAIPRIAGDDAPRGTHQPPPVAASDLVEMTVYQSPTCGCCAEYVTYLRGYGFATEVVKLDDMTALKRARGVPEEVWSCHTVLVGPYIVEGHVPIEAIQALLNDRPAVEGIGLAGMPSGSPGMGGAKTAPFAIRRFADGQTGPFLTL